MFDAKVKDLWCTREDWKKSIGPALRGTGIGFFLGFIPGVGSVIPTAVSYSVEKKVSKYPEKFGTGLIEGVAGPESANNAYVTGSMIPLFTLGIPASPTIAILMGAFMMNGLIPGPFLFTEHPDIVWGVIASMYRQPLRLIMNLPMIPFWLTTLRTPYPVLFSLTMAFMIVGAYSLNNSVFDVGSMLAFGVIGYLFKKVGIPAAPIALTLILGPLMERGLRQSLEISRGDMSIFFTRPISATLIVIAVGVTVISRLGAFRRVKTVDGVEGVMDGGA